MAVPKVFAARMRALAQGVELNSGSALQDALGTALVVLVRSTPVGGPPTSPKDPHPGLARSNWQIARGSARAIAPAASEGEAIARGLAIIRSFRADEDAIISNPVPYINRLNDGSSTQAPAGFVNAAISAAAATARGVRLLVKPRRRQ